ncbi:MAG: DUF4347 domain-containing protein [Okeania sp. SIO3B5]|uniref:DUF4347 domain-containing protein n=1 Tax=Okeania sp. SIO3B5 TaxID=2607811 RepID=UPI001401A00E|nr:DUF4347 domain-containing protein [Okeania sp. SIO3B5]NEO57595.1 DUF4347 domain-containing protein [Okeania sp. SIO3B5]
MLEAASNYRDGRLSRSLKLDDRLPKAPGEGMLVAIAPDVEAIPTLEVGVRAGAKVLVLNPQRDSIAQITEAIGKSKISSLHLVGHGVPGSIFLGGTVLSLANIQQYRPQLLEWGVSEILIYGCNVAAEPQFLQVLHQLTGANIAASTKKVGNAAKGGSWELETVIGEVETRLTFEPQVIRNYPGVFTFQPDVFDPEKLPSLEFSQATYRVREDGTVIGADVTIERTVSLNGISTVEVQLSDGSAKGGEDFDNATQTVEFANGEASKTITIPITDDLTVEGDESLELTLSNPSDLTVLGVQRTATLTILDNEAPKEDAGGDEIADASQVRVGGNKNYKDWVGREDGDDYYKFALGSRSNVDLSLDGMTANADFELLDSKGEVIASSKNLGITPESISQTLDGGVYNLRVSSADDSSTFYDLNLQTQSLLPGITTTGAEAPFFTTAPISENSAFVPALAKSSSLIGMDDFRANPRFAGIDGSGFATVILDTGIDLDHPFFGDRIVHSFDFANGDADASDPQGHGSNVSSIVASSDQVHTGMAPGADIIHLKVFKVVDGKLEADAEAIENALQWVVENAEEYNIASLNMSLSDGGNYTAANIPDYGWGDELKALADKNIIVSSSSGNKFHSHDSQPGVSYPSVDPNSLSIGAVYDSNVGGKGYPDGALANSTDADIIAPFSQRHENLTTVFAPGAPITGANHNGGTVTFDGTSQAAPHVSGIAVLAQQLAEREMGRRLTPNEFGQLLRDSGVAINDGDDEDDNVTNTGDNFKRVNMLALAQEIDVNEAPVVSNPIPDSSAQNFSDFTFAENTFTDPDPGDSLTYSVRVLNGQSQDEGAERAVPAGDLPAWLAFDPAQRTFDVIGDRPDWFKLNLEVKAEDEFGETVTDAFELERGILNRPPVVSNPIPDSSARNFSDFTFAQNTFTDPDPGDSLTYSVRVLNGESQRNNVKSAVPAGNLPAWLTFDPANRTFDVKGNDPNWFKLNLEVEARDRFGETVKDTFELERGNLINRINRPPQRTGTRLFTQGVNWTNNPALRNTLKFTFDENTFTDPDPGDVLTYKAEWFRGGNGRQTIQFNPNTRTFTINPGMTGDNWYTVTATDPHGATATDQIHFYRRHDGIAIDNYIEGGTAFFDANKNGVLDDNEPSATTNEKGEFDLDIDPFIFDTNQNGTVDPSEGRVVIIGGTDTATGLPLETPIYSTPDSTVVTMLTSVAADLVEQGLTVEQAHNQVKNAFSLPSEVDLATLDPVAATEANEPGAAEVFNSMIQVQNTVTQIAHLLDGASTADLDELSGAAIKAIANKVKDGQLNLTTAQPIEGLINDAANAAKAIDPEIKVNLVSDVAAEVADVVAESNDRIDNAASSNTGADISKEVAKVQTITMGETSDDLEELTAGTKEIEQVVAENTGSALDDQIESGVGEDIEVTPGEEIEGTRRRDVLTGGDGDDTITGFQGRDILTGGDGSDRFVYDSLLDAGDIIKDFDPGSDEIILTELLDGLGYQGDNAIADGYIQLASRGGTTMISIDADGPDGPGRFRTFIAVEGISENALNDPSNFGF